MVPPVPVIPELGVTELCESLDKAKGTPTTPRPPVAVTLIVGLQAGEPATNVPVAQESPEPNEADKAAAAPVE